LKISDFFGNVQNASGLATVNAIAAWNEASSREGSAFSLRTAGNGATEHTNEQVMFLEESR